MPIALTDDTEPEPDVQILRRRAVPYKDREAYADDAFLLIEVGEELPRLRPLDQTEAQALRNGRYP